MGKNSEIKALVNVIRAIGEARRAPRPGSKLLRILMDKPEIRAAQGLFRPESLPWETLQRKVHRGVRTWHLTVEQADGVCKAALLKIKSLGGIRVMPNGQVGVVYE